MDKNIVKGNLSGFINKGYRGAQIEAHTSGTTGSGMVFPISVEMENRQFAVWRRYTRSLGIDLQTRMGWFGGKMIVARDVKKGPYIRLNKPGRQVMFSPYHLNRGTVREYCREISDRGLTWLHGYPSNLANLASLMIDEGLEPLPEVRHITTCSENLLPHQIDMLTGAFPNAIVRTHYAMSEGVANFSQNLSGAWEIDMDFGIPEFVPLEESDPTLCRIIGTCLWNEAFPLVRYDTGDVARVEWNADGTLRRIIAIDGRQDDYIVTPKGEKISGLVMGFIFQRIPNMLEAQIVQRSREEVEIKVVKGKHYSLGDEKRLLEEISRRMGAGIKARVSYVEKIERMKSGKMRMVVNKHCE